MCLRNACSKAFHIQPSQLLVSPPQLAVWRPRAFGFDETFLPALFPSHLAHTGHSQHHLEPVHGGDDLATVNARLVTASEGRMRAENRKLLAAGLADGLPTALPSFLPS